MASWLLVKCLPLTRRSASMGRVRACDHSLKTRMAVFVRSIPFVRSSSPSIEILIGCWATKGIHLEYKANKRPGNAHHTESNDAVPDIGVSSLKGVRAK